eukprot:9520839-Alexandrium_andersonii.AAC.1
MGGHQIEAPHTQTHFLTGQRARGECHGELARHDHGQRGGPGVVVAHAGHVMHTGLRRGGGLARCDSHGEQRR